MAEVTIYRLPATTATDNTGSGSTANAWVNPGNISAKDDTNATDTFTNTGTTSPGLNLSGTNLGFSTADIPSGRTILGVEVRIRFKVDTTANGVLIDNNVQLIKGGSRSGTNKATAAQIGATYEERVYGGPTDLWGNTLADTDITASDFGVSLRASYSPATMSNTVLQIDSYEIRVYYASAYAQPVNDSVTMSDAQAKAVGKNGLADSVTMSDGQAKAVGKNLLVDSVTMSDAQAKNVGKSVSDSVTTSDNQTKAVGKGIADTVTMSDAIVKAIGKFIADTVTMSDALVKAVGKFLADSVTMSDDQSKAVGKTLTDSVSMSDSISKGLGKFVSDTVTMSDALVKSIGRTISDVITTADAQAKAIGKFIADTVTVSDGISSGEPLTIIRKTITLAKRAFTLTESGRSSTIKLPRNSDSIELKR